MEEQAVGAPKDRPSNLYDSQEFHAMMSHLKRASQFSPMHLFNSPFYRQRLNQIYKQSADSTNRITWQHEATKERARGTVSNVSIAWKLWKQVKQGLMGILPKKHVK